MVLPNHYFPLVPGYHLLLVGYLLRVPYGSHTFLKLFYDACFLGSPNLICLNLICSNLMCSNLMCFSPVYLDATYEASHVQKVVASGSAMSNGCSLSVLYNHHQVSLPLTLCDQNIHAMAFLYITLVTVNVSFHCCSDITETASPISNLVFNLILDEHGTFSLSSLLLSGSSSSSLVTLSRCISAFLDIVDCLPCLHITCKWLCSPYL